MPHEDIAVELYSIGRPTADRGYKSGSFLILKNVVADSCHPTRIKSPRVVGALVRVSLGMVRAVRIVPSEVAELDDRIAISSIKL